MRESSNNFQAVILRKHGRNVLRNLRAAENTAVKIAKWINNRIFNIRCIQADIVPNSLKLDSVVRGTNTAIVPRNAENRPHEHQQSDDAGKIDKSRWVVDKSNKTLTTDEHSVLEKGLIFAVTPRDFPLKDVLVSTEIACKYLSAPMG